MKLLYFYQYHPLLYLFIKGFKGYLIFSSNIKLNRIVYTFLLYHAQNLLYQIIIFFLGFTNLKKYSLFQIYDSEEICFNLY